MNKVIILIASLFVLVACTPNIEYRDKKVPVYMVPEPPLIERPELPIHAIDITINDISDPEMAKDKLGEVARAYVLSVRLLLNWGNANQKIVATYRRMSEKDFSVDPITFSNAMARRTESEESAVALFGASEESEGSSAPLESSTSDYGTIKIYADREFNDITNKYEEDKQQILEGNDETESD